MTEAFVALARPIASGSPLGRNKGPIDGTRERNKRAQFMDAPRMHPPTRCPSTALP